MSNDLDQVIWIIVLFFAGLAGLLVLLSKLEPPKGTHRADLERPVRLRREG